MKVTLKPDGVEIEEAPAMLIAAIAATILSVLAATAFLKGAGDASDSEFVRKHERKKELK